MCAALALASTLAARPAEASRVSRDALETMRHLAVQYNGRVKPFDSFAREVLTQMTGEEQWQRQDPVVSVLSMIAQPEAWQPARVLAVPFGPLREKLGLDKKATHVSYAELLATRSLMNMPNSPPM